MNVTNKIILVIVLLSSLSACHPQYYDDQFVLSVYFSPSQNESWHWAAASNMIFTYKGMNYSQSDLVDYQYYYFGYSASTIDDMSWLFWDLGGISSYVTGTLSLSEIEYSLNRGNPLILNYGDYYSGHFIVIHGYDHQGYVFLHEPGYGSRKIHFSELQMMYFHGQRHYWESTLVIDH